MAALFAIAGATLVRGPRGARRRWCNQRLGQQRFGGPCRRSPQSDTATWCLSQFIGRIVGAVLMVVGIGFFGVLTANVAAWFV